MDGSPQATESSPLLVQTGTLRPPEGEGASGRAEGWEQGQSKSPSAVYARGQALSFLRHPRRLLGRWGSQPSLELDKDEGVSLRSVLGRQRSALLGSPEKHVGRPQAHRPRRGTLEPLSGGSRPRAALGLGGRPR